ncbi:hypothetical protein AB4238_13530 [Shewanella sp. 10N.286.45.A1]|uniref:hypothetical protein n=1 Tax=Shewanella sp. 10N.286.45.A1 TaxID=3229694 RepID=UPI00355293E6
MPDKESRTNREHESDLRFIEDRKEYVEFANNQSDNATSARQRQDRRKQSGWRIGTIDGVLCLFPHVAVEPIVAANAEIAEKLLNIKYADKKMPDSVKAAIEHLKSNMKE